MRLIFAESMNQIIGVDNDLPWKLPEDLKQFKEYTLGKTVIMGRRTFESMGCKPLPGRENIVVSSTLSADDHTGINILRDISEIEKYPEAVIIGGSEIFNHAMTNNLVTEIRQTVVLKQIEIEEDKHYTKRQFNIPTSVWHRFEIDRSNYGFDVHLYRKV